MAGASEPVASSKSVGTAYQLYTRKWAPVFVHRRLEECVKSSVSAEPCSEVLSSGGIIAV